MADVLVAAFGHARPRDQAFGMKVLDELRRAPPADARVVP